MVMGELLEWSWLVLDFEKSEWGHLLMEHNYHVPLARLQRWDDHWRVGGPTAVLAQCGMSPCLSWRGWGPFHSSHPSLARGPSIPPICLGLWSWWHSESGEYLGLWVRVVHVEWVSWLGAWRDSQSRDVSSHGAVYELWADCGWWVATQGSVWCWFGFPAAPRYC